MTQVFGIGASKTDLQYHGIGIANATVTFPDGTTATHSFLYSGIKRLLAGGISSSNANYNVEVDQDLLAYKPADPICTGRSRPAAAAATCGVARATSCS